MTTPSFKLPQAVLDAMIAEAAGPLAEVTAIDSRLEAARGTQAERVRKAEAALRADETSASFVWPRPKIGKDSVLSFFAYADELEAHITGLRDELAEVRETCKGLVNARLKAEHADVTGELASLLEQRKAIVDGLGAISSLTGVAFDIPNAPKIRGGSGGTRVKSSEGRHYVYDPTTGDKTFYSNESFSYLAFKFGVSSDELRKAISELGVDNVADSWAVVVTLTGTLESNAHFGKTQTFGIGHEVTVTTPAE